MIIYSSNVDGYSVERLFRFRRMAWCCYWHTFGFTRTQRCVYHVMYILVVILMLVGSRWSPLGLVHKYQQFNSTLYENSIKPFWILHLGLKHQRTRRMAAYPLESASPDAAQIFTKGDTHYDTILILQEMQIIQIQGLIKAYLPVLYYHHANI